MMWGVRGQTDYSVERSWWRHWRDRGEPAIRELYLTAVPGRAGAAAGAGAARPGPARMLREIMSADGAVGALSEATVDVPAVLMLIHALEGRAHIDDLLALAWWVAETETFPHEGDTAPSPVRPAATRAEMRAVLDRADRLGLVWEEPAGVWNLPGHATEALLPEPTLATTVDHLLRFTGAAALTRRARGLGLIGAGEEFDPARHGAALRSFLCCPRRVRALVSTAPHAVRRELRHFAVEGVHLDSADWAPRRREAVAWGLEHLLLVLFPGEADTGAAGPAEGEELAGDPAAGWNAAMPAPVALALRGDRHALPRPHEIEARPLPPGHQPDPVARATAAVAIASAYMDLWGHGGYLDGDLRQFEGAVAAGDFAAVHGIDEGELFDVIGMLAAVRLIDPATGLPTAAAHAHWFTAGPAERWTWLAAGWLRGPDEWFGGVPRHPADPLSPERMAHVLRRACRELTVFAAGLEPTMMAYECCVEDHLWWRCGAPFFGRGEEWRELAGKALHGARTLGVFVDGVGGAPAAHIAGALSELWLSRQDLPADAIAATLLERAPGFVRVADRVRLRTRPDPGDPRHPQLVAVVSGVPGAHLAALLDDCGHREATGARSRWLLDPEALAAGIRRGRTAAGIVADFTAAGARGGGRALLIRRLRALGEAVDLELDLRLVGEGADAGEAAAPGADAPAEPDAGEADPGGPGDPGDPGEGEGGPGADPAQLRLF